MECASQAARGLPRLPKESTVAWLTVVAAGDRVRAEREQRARCPSVRSPPLSPVIFSPVNNAR